MAISVQTSNAALLALENLAAAREQAAGLQLGAPSATAPTDSGSAPSAAWNASGIASADPLSGLISGLSSAASIADAAVSAGGQVSELLAQMQQAAQAAADPNLSQDARGSLNNTFKADLAAIQKTVSQASVGGANLIDGSISGTLQVPAGDGSTAATLSPANLTLGGPLIGVNPKLDLSNPADAQTLAAELQSAIGNVGQAVGNIATQGEAIQAHLAIVAQAGSALLSTSGAPVDPSVDQEGALLQALQVQQQLSTGGASLANQSPGAILSLFR
ncbi:MAG: hypothetical protein ACHP7N_00610 [Caulobacterales bacterium]